MKLPSIIFAFFYFSILQAQPQQRPPQIKITGIVSDQLTGQPLEFATVTLQHFRRTEMVFGGLTDEKGYFEIEMPAGKYNITFEYLSYGSRVISEKELKSTQDLGTITLSPDEQLLDELTIRAERTTVEMKLDKRVYNLGQDLMVKGGNASDVLDNVPSVAVDAEGNVSLRGNESVRILIDGRPSTAININDALKLIPAETLEKVEVITNPSARYDAEGSSGIINIVLKKGKESGMNGVFTATIGYPENSTLTGTVNYKVKNVNFFTSQGFRKVQNPGTFYNETRYLESGTDITRNYVIEDRVFDRKNLGYNGNIGLDWFITPKTTWTHNVLYRTSDEQEIVNTNLDFFNNENIYQNSTFRYNDGKEVDKSLEYTSNFRHRFKKEDHTLSFDVSLSKNDENEAYEIQDITQERNDIGTTQNNQLLQLDYVLPINQKSRLEAGYRGSFVQNRRDFLYEKFLDNAWINQTDFSNNFEYLENVHSLYSQFGSKLDKFNYLLGLRWEDSDIHVNQISSENFNNKKYNNFFPSAFLNYEFDESFGLSLSYSRRIQRPRGRHLNPFSEISSSLNIFQGNPDLNPVYTSSFDFGMIKRWEIVTLNASVYYNISKDPFQFIRRESGLYLPDGSAVLFSGPVNAGTEDRLGIEFTLNLNPSKKWRVNANFNFFRVTGSGTYEYTTLEGNLRSIDLTNEALTWSARFNSKYTLPWNIDWQANFSYNAPQKTAQGKSIGLPTLNSAFSKDIWKDRATLNFNISDVFNTRRRISESNIPGVLYSYTNMQWRQRQFSLGFTYRFNRKKSEKDQQKQQNREEFDGMM